MRYRVLFSMSVLVMVIGLVSLASVPVGGQAPAPAAKAKAAAKTPWGDPDLQGNWSHNTATPLERPKELAGRQFLTNEEVALIQKRTGELFGDDGGDAAFGAVFVGALTNTKYVNNDGVGNYNQFWLVPPEFDNRTSLIMDPPDGKIPALTPEAVKRLAVVAEYKKQHPADGPEDIALSQRCVTGDVPMLGAGYNNYYQIAQTPGYVVINMEMRHDNRVIPIDGRPHLPRNVRQWLGDSRGHWEGNTLVVDTTNFADRGNQGGFRTIVTPNLHVVERFTRVENSLKYEVTIDDPTTYSKPWTAVLYWKPTKDLIYEYACHEGNEAMPGTLGGYRAQEKTAQEAARKGSR